MQLKIGAYWGYFHLWLAPKYRKKNQHGSCWWHSKILLSWLSPTLTDESIGFLDSLTSEYRHRFTSVLPQANLIPKHHFVEHYPQLIKSFGPLMSLCKPANNRRFLGQLGHSRESRRTGEFPFRGVRGRHAGQNCKTLSDNSYNWHFSGPIGISALASESWSTPRQLSSPLDETVAWLPRKSDGKFWKLSQAFWSKKNSYLFDSINVSYRFFDALWFTIILYFHTEYCTNVDLA